MNMKNSRRSVEKLREPILKRPRLAEEERRNRSTNGIVREFPQRFPAVDSPGTGPLIQRFRANEEDDERDNSLREAYQQQQQELVREYKNALAELTFNSKPIITNLTIIAGENLHAAKGIAGAICVNIIEVPAEQKLPSLYLLDSIVKNIARDYIKCFAARLPEVFCKAYRQVDSSIHSSMRHLFGTWKGVFPSDCLQLIEKELDFLPAINGSSSGLTATRLNSQSQRPPHSIHVNPKYVEARERLQPSNRVKITTNDNTRTITENVERPNKTTIIGNGRPWTDLSVKMNNTQRPQREALSEHVNEKSTGAGYDYDSDSPERLDMGIGISGRITERGLDNLWYGAGSNAIKTTTAQRNAFGSKHGFPSHGPTRSTQVVAQLHPPRSISNRSSTGNSGSWKNSEEEEYAWDDMKSTLTDHGESNRVTSTDSITTTQRRETAFGQQTSSMWPVQESHLVDGLKPVNISSRISGKSEDCFTSFNGVSTSIGSSLGRVGLQARTEGSVTVAPSTGSLVNLLSESGQQQCPSGPASSSVKSIHLSSHSPSSILHQQPKTQNLTEQDHLKTQTFSEIDKRNPQLAGQLSQAPHFQNTDDTDSTLSLNYMQHQALRNLHSNLSQQAQNSQTSSSSSMPASQGHQISFLKQSVTELMQSQPSGQTQKSLPQSSGYSNDGTADIPENSSKSNLLAAIMKSGLLSSHLLTGGVPNITFQNPGELPSPKNIPNYVRSESPPSHLATSSIPVVTPSSELGPTSQANKPVLVSSPQRSTLKLPLPAGGSPASSEIDIANPLSSLLNSLVGKGLISASSTESQILSAPKVHNNLENKKPDLAKSISMQVSSDPMSSSIVVTSSRNGPRFLDSASKTINALPKATMMEKKGLIGVEFKPEMIRELHPQVISALFDDLLHQCCLCGLRLRHQEQLEQHMEWHDSKKLEQISNKRVSRMWFMSLGDWINGNVELPLGRISTASMEELVKPEDQNKPVVPSDESQSVCVFCGEPFEDFYSHVRDEWMYRGAVYLTIPAALGMKGGKNESVAAQGPIVHSYCISPNSAYELGLA